jgi:hypothetical protein
MANCDRRRRGAGDLLGGHSRTVHSSYVRTWRVLLADVSIELSSETRAADAQLRWFFGALPASRREQAVRIRVTDCEAPSPARAADATDGPVSIWEDGSYVRLRHDDGLTASVSAREIVIGGWDDGHWRSLRQLLGAGLASWFGELGTLVLHGGLIELDGAGLGVLGPTGGGKSTLVAAALSAGWRVHADDLTLVRQAGHGALVAHGIPKPVSADADLLSALGAPVTPLDDDSRGRGVLPASLLAVGWVPIRALVVVGHSDQDGSITSLSHEDRLTAVFSSSFEVTRLVGRRRDLSILAQLSTVPSFRLEHAVQRERRLERALAMLKEIGANLDSADAPTTTHQ